MEATAMGRGRGARQDPSPYSHFSPLQYGAVTILSLCVYQVHRAMGAGTDQVVRIASSATEAGIEIIEAIGPVAEAAGTATAEITIAAGDGVAMSVSILLPVTS